MQFVIVGFTDEMGFRVFAFEGVGADRVRTEYKVKADLTLIRKYGIRLQELPLLCRAILEQHLGSDAQRTFTYTEADMSLRADFCAAQAEAKRKVPRKPRSETLGNAWRGMPIG